MENVFFSFDLSLLIVAMGAFILYLLLRKREAGPVPQPPAGSPPRDPMVFDLSIRLGEDGRWQILDEKGQLPGALEVLPGDTVTWRTGETDAFFQFPRLELFDQLRTSWTTQIGRQDVLSLTVSHRACPGTHVYGVFCNVNDRTKPEVGYAEGGSPPEIIVKPY